ncbi:hypothetical protein BCY91_14140 [Pelobium manganitolerans]|uniref:Uncharacterized protein n=1 Tax=Pelobium manganitolerans TaxID=1842495 RepID=A0A419S9Y4_9SPHI|nr:hypothetical protein [Pelobium manganitolerans]RKD19013.1 hypothetical protein BCY91_14140 [Pelobium manganitolerans]
MTIELLEKIKFVEQNRIQVAAKTPEGIALLKSVYQDVFNETYAEGCGPCHEQAFFRLMKILNRPKSFIPMSEKKYILKEGYQVSIFGGPEVYTNDNLTDEIAAKLLKDRPALKSSFAVIPSEEKSKGNPKPERADVLIAKIKEAASEKEVDEITGDDQRATVVKAALERKAELKKGTEHTKVLTQQDLDDNPELAEQGFKVGDKVKIEEQ